MDFSDVTGGSLCLLSWNFMKTWWTYTGVSMEIHKEKDD